MSVTQLGYVGIGVRDVESWETFATGILGLEVAARLDDGTRLLRMDDYHNRIAVHPSDNEDVHYVGLQVPNAMTLRQLEQSLNLAGYRTEHPDRSFALQRRVTDLFTVDDPNGIRLEIYYGAFVDLSKPFKSPRSIQGFNTGDLGLGHLVLWCKDSEETEAFYTQQLGFRVSDYAGNPADGGRLVFLHCNERHHSLAFAQRDMDMRLGHIMVELNSLDDVGMTYDLVQKEGVPLATTLGRHMNDRMLSFYLYSPNGIRIEYGWGGIRVDDATWVAGRYWTAGDIWGHEKRAMPEGMRPATAGLSQGEGR